MRQKLFVLLAWLISVSFAMNAQNNSFSNKNEKEYPVTELSKKDLNKKFHDVVTIPGLKTGKTTYIMETFDTEIPATWTIIDNGSGDLSTWFWADTYTANSIPLTGFACIDSDENGSGNTTAGELISPEFDCSSATVLYLEFDARYNDMAADGVETFKADVFDGTNWQNVLTWDEDHGDENTPEHVTIDISAHANANCKVRFSYTDDGWDWFAGVDNVSVIEPEPYEFALTYPEGGTYLANTTHDYTATIANNGTSNDTYDLTFAASGSWTYSFYNAAGDTEISTLQVNSGESSDFIVRVAIAAGASTFDTDTETITVTSQGNAAHSENFDITTTAIAEGSLFADFNDGVVPPAGWQGSGWNSSFTDYEGGQAAYSSGGGDTLITPLLSIIDGDQLSFYAKNSSSDGGEMNIIISSDLTNWTSLSTTPGALTSDYQEFTVNFTGAEAGEKYIAFVNVDEYFYLDFVIGPAIAPYNFKIEADDGISATSNTSALYNVSIINTGSSSDDFTPSITSTNTWTNTLYEEDSITPLTTPITIAAGDTSIFVLDVAVPGSATIEETDTATVTVTSAESGKAEKSVKIVTTAIVPYTPPYSESFNEGYMPDYWEEFQGILQADVVPSGTSSSWSEDGFLNEGTTGAMKLNIWSTNIDEWAISPLIDLGDGSVNHVLLFDIGLTDYNNSNPPESVGEDDKFAVVISTDGGVTWSDVNVLQLWDNTTTPSYGDISTTGEKIFIDLTGYSGIVKLGFYGESTVGSNGDNDLFIDNISIVEIVDYGVNLESPTGVAVRESNSYYYTVNISNMGVNNDAYTLNLTGNTWTSTLYAMDSVTEITTPFSINSYEDSAFLVKVDVPADANTFDTDAVDITATSQGDGSVTDVTTITTTALSELALFADFNDAVVPPDNWEKIGWFSSSTAYEGDHGAYSFDGGDTLITPLLNITDGDELRFYAKNSASSGGEMNVLISSDHDTWTELTTSPAALTNNFQDFVVNMTAAEAGEKYIAWVGVSEYVYLDYIIGPDIVPYYKTLFYVTDGTDPLQNAEILIDRFELLTNAEGKDSLKLPNGTYDYTVNLETYQQLTGSVTITDTDTQVDVVLIEATNDLAVTELIIPDDPIFGGNIELKAVIENIGTDAIAAGAKDITFKVDGVVNGTAANPAEIPTGEKDTVTYTWAATQGTYELRAIAPTDQFPCNDSVVVNEIDILQQGILFADFNDGVVPPEDWISTNEIWNSTSYYEYLYEGAYSIYASSPDTLITPLLEISEGDELSFYAKNSEFSGGAMKILISEDLQNWSTIYEPTLSSFYSEFSHTFTAGEAGNKYIAFTNETGYVYLDYITGPLIKVWDNDMAITELILPEVPAATGDIELKAIVKNLGLNTQTSPKAIEFFANGSTIGTANTSIDLATNEVDTVTFTWSISNQGVYDIEVQVPADEVLENDSLVETDYYVLAEGSLYSSFENEIPPNGWRNNDNWLPSFSSYVGSKSTYNVTTTEGDTLITPLVTIDSDSELHFFARTTATNTDQRLQVVFSSDLTSWTTIGSEIQFTAEQSWTYYNVDLSSLDGTDVYLGLAASTITEEGNIYVDHLAGPVITPIAPNAVTLISPVDEATETTLMPELSWERNPLGGEPTAYKVYLSTTEADVTDENEAALIETTDASSYQAGPLEYESTYYWKIVATNETGDAANSPQRSFTTKTDPSVATPYFENFENLGPLADTTWEASINSYSGVKENHGTSESTGLAFDVWDATQNYVITMPISGITTASKLAFDYRMVDYSGYLTSPNATTIAGNDKVEFFVSSDYGANWTKIHTIDESNHTVSLDFANVQLDLSAYDGETIKIKILTTWDATNDGDYYVDIDNLMVGTLHSATFEVLDAATTVQNAVIEITDKQLTTNASGESTIELVDGNYAYTASHPDYDFDVTGEINVSGQDITEIVDMTTYTVTFSVTDGTTPVSGASININNETITTDASGIATIKVPNGDYAYTVSATGYDDQSGTLTVAGGEVSININYSGNLHTISFNVTDSESGNPLNDVNININGQNLSTVDGVATIDLADGNYSYTASKDGYEQVSGTIEVNGSDVSENIVMTASTEFWTVTFNVTDGTNAIEGATVSLSGYGDQTTDDSGVATFSEMVSNGTFDYTVTAAGYIDGSGTITVSGADVGEDVTLVEEVVLYTVSFNVTDGSSPIQGAVITLQDHGQQTTNVNGYAEFTEEVEDGTYDYSITANGYLQTSGTITVNGTDITEDVTMTEATEFWTVTFNVTDGTDAIQGATISLEGYADITTNEYGTASYTDEVSDGTYNYSINASGFVQSTGSVTVDGADITEDVTMTEATDFWTVTFTVTDETNPIDGATVTLQGYGDATTDINGIAEYTTMVTDGTYTYSVVADGYNESTGSVTVNGDDVSEEVTMTAQTELWTATFTITDGTNPIEGATVMVETMGEQVSDANGIAVYNSMMSDGTYNYEVAASGFETINGTTTINGADVDIDVTMDETGIYNTQAEGFRIYPNPTKGSFYIDVNGNFDAIVYNSTGQVVLTGKITGKSVMHLHGQTQGIYTIHLRNDQQILMSRIIIK